MTSPLDYPGNILDAICLWKALPLSPVIMSLNCISPKKTEPFNSLQAHTERDEFYDIPSFVTRNLLKACDRYE
jgi:hypothetical protein